MIDLRIVLLSGAQVVGLVLQVGILLFSYVKTGKLAPMIVAISTIVLAVLPFFVNRFVRPDQYLFFASFANLANTGLFVWLVYALSTPVRRSLSDSPRDVSENI